MLVFSNNSLALGVIMSQTNIALLVMSLVFSSSALADTCDETALTRVEAADQLISTARTATALDQAPLLERAQILLEKTLEDDPSCDQAQTLLSLTETLKPEFQANSAAAAVDAIIVRAADTLTILERDGVTNPEVLETLRFQLAALARELGDTERVNSLTERAAALAGAQ